MTSPFGLNDLPAFEDEPLPEFEADLPSFEETPDSFIQRALNAVNNVRKITATVNPLMRGAATPTERAFMQQRLAESQGTFVPALKQVQQNIRNLADKEFYKRTWEEAKEMGRAMIDNPGQAAATVVSLPVMMLDMAVGAPLRAATGIDLSDSEAGLLSPEERADAIQATAGNLVAVATGVGVAKQAASFRVAPVARQIARGTPELAQAPKLGKIGRAIQEDVIGAAVGGIVQGAVENVGQDDMLGSMAAGLVFAPLGVVTGVYRGKFGQPDAVERALTTAYDLSVEKHLKFSANKTMEELTNNALALLESDNVASAVMRGQVKTKRDAIGILPNVKNPLEVTQEISSDMGFSIHKKADGSADLLFWGPERVVTPEQKLEFAHKGTVAGMHQPDAGVLLREYLPKHYTKALFNEFADRLTNGKSFAENIVEFAESKGLRDKLPELQDVFTQHIKTEVLPKVLEPDELATWQKLQDRLGTERNKSVQDRARGITELAFQTGTYLSNESGRIGIREGKSHDLLHTVDTTEDAIDFLGRIGVRDGAEFDPSAPIPSGAGGSVPLPTHIDEPYKPPQSSNWTNRVINFDVRTPIFTTMRNWVEGLDVKHGTDLKHGYLEATQRASRQTQHLIQRELDSPEMKKISTLAQGLSPKRLEEITLYRESLTPDEVKAEMLAWGKKGGQQAVAEGAIKLGESFAADNVDVHKLLRARRAFFELDNEMRAKAERGAYDMGRMLAQEFNESKEMFAVRKLDVEENARKQVFASTEYGERRLKIEQEFALTDVELGHLNAIGELASKAPGTLAHMVRMIDTIKDPDGIGAGRAALATKLGLTAKELELAGNIDAAYDRLGTKFGIADFRKIKGYVQHYAMFTDPKDSFSTMHFGTALEDSQSRKFVSELMRTGELEYYERNALTALQQYTRAGYKARVLYPEVDKWTEKLKTELAKIKSSNQRAAAASRFIEYEQEITGQRSIDGRAAEEYYVKFLKELGVPDADIATVTRQANLTDTAIKLSSSGLMGGRLIMGIRDYYETALKYYSFHGAKALGRYIRKFNQFDERWWETAKRKGIISETDFADFYNPAQNYIESGSAGQRGLNELHVEVNKFAGKAAEVGFTLSGQPYVYKRAQVATYIERSEFIRDVLNDYMFKRNGLDTKQKAYDKLFVNKHDEATIKRFDEMVSNGAIEEARDFLAIEEMRLISGSFGHGNHTSHATQWYGRMFNQLGMWAMHNRSVYLKMGGRGTGHERLRTTARMATVQTAAHMAAGAVGVNLANFMVGPWSVAFTGGPLPQVLNEGMSAMRASTYGSEEQERYATQEFARSVKMFVPFGYAANDLNKARELTTNGEDWRAVLQALGFKIDTDY